MVAVIENRADIEGFIANVADHAGRPGYLRVTVIIKKAYNVKSYPNLARADEGGTIAINVRKEEAEKMVVDKEFRGIVRKAGAQEYFLV
jgi:hypothetical protein